MNSIPLTRLFFLLLLPVFLWSGCTGTKLLSRKSAEKDAAFYVNHLVENQIKADWMEARMKIQYEDKYMAVGGSVTVKMRKDSVIWLSVKKLGFEVARALITPDSIIIIDRLAREYYLEDIGYIQKSYNIPASMNTLQSILLGNPVFFDPQGLSLEKKELSWHLFGKDENMERHFYLEATNLFLQMMQFDDIREDQKLNYELSDYRTLDDNQNFSYIRKLAVESPDTGPVTIDIKITKAELNVPQNIKFTIPERYTRAD